MTLEGDNDIQGLISIEPVPDQHYIEMHLIESAPHNFGAAKQYAGVAGNLVAFCCKMSFEMGFDGFVAFTAKTDLVGHYTKTLGAQVIYGQNRMAIATESAKNLVIRTIKITSMKNKEKYQKLDEVGIVGSQGKTSIALQAYHKKKTGEAIRLLKAAGTRSSKKIAVSAR